MVAYARWILLVIVSFLGGELAGGISASSLESRIKLLTLQSQLIFNDPLINFTGELIVPNLSENSLQGKKIQCNACRIELGATKGCLQGSLDPISVENIALLGNCSFVGDKGAKVLGVAVSGPNNLLGGWVDIQGPLQCMDSNAVLELGVENCLGQNIMLGGGTVRLFSTVELSQGVIICGPGSMDGASRDLILRSGNTVFSSPLVWSGSVDLFLYDKAIISGAWTIGSGSPVVVKISGFGRVLDLSLGGTIFVQSGCSLVLEDVVIQGLGSSGGTILLQDDTASVTFVGCTINFVGDYALNVGKVNCCGRDSTFITGASTCLFGGSCLLTVDAITLYYDALLSSLPGVIVLSPSNLIELNEGRILSVHKKQMDPRLIVDDASAVCSGRLDLTVDEPLLFRGLHSSNLELIGSDLFVSCINSGLAAKPALISVANNKKAVVRDIVINNFDPACVSCGVGAELAFGNNVELNLSRAVDLTSTLTIVGNAIIHGSGNVLDCSHGGIISIASGASLTLQDLVLSGIGNDFGRIVLADSTSTLFLKNVTLSLSGNYTQTMGTFCFSGTKSVIITGNNTISFEGKGCCVVDGVHVIYDPLGFPDIKNIRPALPDGVNLIFRKGGSCGVVDVARILGSLYLLDSTYDLQRNEALSSTRKLSFVGASDACVVRGQGFAVSLPFSVSSVIEVPEHKRLEFKDTVFRDFRCDHLSIGAGSTIAFGDEAVIQLSADVVISCNLNISGKALVDCCGHRILFQDGCGFVVEPGGSLELRNGFLLDLHDAGNPIKMLDISSRLVLHDMACSLSADFTISQGSLNIAGNTYFSTHRNYFIYSSPGVLTLKPASCLVFDQESIFRYDSKGGAKKFVFTDKTSCLYLESATLSVGIDGLDLSSGSLCIDGFSVVSGDVSPSAYGVHFKSDSFHTKVLLKATLDLQGLILND